ncbi:ComEC/Rec2 family competence protein [Roseospira visakhapatnamensis]|uniref:Competence protein ComEC n=1 Tax=Roseospira visakhapatnamensis TaxID=390880 RepID=A0A7W6RCP4_9PROT|nr:ComEC/Rec2 family competence protein [Roseospira visakhapatnamensis]MBB4266080.1 competence protein ComEC [Roseospira visakhapatnamensis]
MAGRSGTDPAARAVPRYRAPAGAVVGAVAMGPRVLGRALAATLAAERARWPLWLPVALGLGIAGYLALPVEPPRWTGAALMAGLAVLLLLARRAAWITALLVALTAAAVGFVVVQERARAVAAPVLAERLGPVSVSGRVVLVEPRPGRVRVTLADVAMARLAPADTPARVRVTLTRGAPPPPGTWITTRAILSPPPRPAAPDAFPFPRRAWFERLGAVGFAVGPWTRPDPAPAPTVWARLVAVRETARVTVAGRLGEGLSGAEGALATALSTGDRGAVPVPVVQAFRDAGLAHLLAISGLHMSMIAGLLFVGARSLLALWPAAALRLDLKKPAALVALAGTAAYLMLSGANVPAQRAFLMTGLVLAAVLLERTAISPRVVAWAAAAVLLIQPQALAGPSFQMSFAAVLALVAAWDLAAPRLAAWRRAGPGGADRWLARGVALYLGGILLTSVVAGLATLPFAAFHFNRVPVWGLAANMLAVPIMGLWVMPWLLAVLALLPLGLEGPALVPLGWGLGAIRWVAETVAGWPGASASVPAAPTWGLAAVALGGLWLCLWRRSWRLLGIAGLVLGLLSPWSRPPPDLLVTDTGRTMAVRAGGGGGLILSPGRADGFARRLWRDRWGGASPEPWPGPGQAAADGALRCDPLGCVLRRDGRVLALAWTRAALAEDCPRADVVVTPLPTGGACVGPSTVIDRRALARDGSHALWLDDGSGGGTRGRPSVRTASDALGDRLWSPRTPDGP